MNAWQADKTNFFFSILDENRLDQPWQKYNEMFRKYVTLRSLMKFKIF